MSEFPPDLSTWLTVLILVVWAFFMGRWSVRAKNRPPQRHQHPSRSSSPPVTPYNSGAGVDAPASHGYGLDMALEEELKSLLLANRKIEAIKLARERLGLGLKEAKDLVESL